MLLIRFLQQFSTFKQTARIKMKGLKRLKKDDQTRQSLSVSDDGPLCLHQWYLFPMSHGRLQNGP